MANFKVGDMVRARGLDGANTYTGTVVEVTDSYLKVDKDGGGSCGWRCKALPCGNYASANGMWDNKTKLELIEECSAIVGMDTADITIQSIHMSDLPTIEYNGFTITNGTPSSINKPTMSLKTIYRNLTRTEPQRTFVKAGVCNDDGSLTTEGRDLFLEYLLKQNGEAFKKDVVDAIVTEKEECK